MPGLNIAEWYIQNSRHELILLITPGMKCCGYASCLHTLMDKEKSIKKDKGITVV